MENYKLLFADSCYEFSGSRLSIMRQKSISNINIGELKSNTINNKSYTVFNLIYINKEYKNKVDTLCLLALIKNTYNDWRIEELCENSTNKGELYINNKLEKNYSMSNLSHSSLSDSIGVALMMEYEIDKKAFDEKYKIFEKNHWLQVRWKDMKINTMELVLKMTNSYFDPKLNRGFVQFVFSKENGEFTFESCVYFKINPNNNIEYYITDGQKKESNLFQ